MMIAVILIVHNRPYRTLFLLSCVHLKPPLKFLNGVVYIIFYDVIILCVANFISQLKYCF